MRNALKFLPVVSRVANSIGIDHSMSRVGQNRKANFSFAVGGNLLGKLSAFGWTIDADGVDAYLLVEFYE